MVEVRDAAVAREIAAVVVRPLVVVFGEPLSANLVVGRYPDKRLLLSA